jgi:hypothetical protein
MSDLDINSFSAQCQLLNIGISVFDNLGNIKSHKTILDELATIFLKFKQEEDKIYKITFSNPSLEGIKKYEEIIKQHDLIIESVLFSLSGIRNANKLLSIITDRMNELIRV